MNALAPASPLTPLDPRARRDEWRLAALVLALVATAGGVVEAEGSVARPAAAGARRSSPRAVRVASGRGIRPPRSC
jgi:hypothetical protein